MAITRELAHAAIAEILQAELDGEPPEETSRLWEYVGTALDSFPELQNEFFGGSGYRYMLVFQIFRFSDFYCFIHVLLSLTLASSLLVIDD